MPARLRLPRRTPEGDGLRQCLELLDLLALLEGAGPQLNLIDPPGVATGDRSPTSPGREPPGRPLTYVLQSAAILWRRGVMGFPAGHPRCAGRADFEGGAKEERLERGAQAATGGTGGACWGIIV